MPPRRRRPSTRRWYRLRWTDVLAMAGLVGFLAQVVDRYTTGQAADPTLTFFSVLLATGAISVPRVRDALLRRYGGDP